MLQRESLYTEVFVLKPNPQCDDICRNFGGSQYVGWKVLSYKGLERSEFSLVKLLQENQQLNPQIALIKYGRLLSLVFLPQKWRHFVYCVLAPGFLTLL